MRYRLVLALLLLAAPATVHALDCTPNTLSVGQVTVIPRSIWEIRINVLAPEGARIRGQVQASGGRNDIQVILAGEDDFAKWRDGHGEAAIYDSGKTTAATIDAVLPKPGIYYLGFSNAFSWIRSKYVVSEVRMQPVGCP